jgi:hypothetical protein
MSANGLVDAAGSLDYRASVVVGSGSNLIVGQIVDLLHANNNCNIFVAGGFGSGVIEVQVQTSDALTSGSFSDPTSGLPVFPSNLVSGGKFFANSGILASGVSLRSAVASGAPLFASGGIDFGHFQRPHRYARLIWNSGVFPNYAVAGFISAKKTTGSGGGTTQSPGSGSVNV